MKAPSFWYPKEPPTFGAISKRVLLAPLSLLYSFGGRLRHRMIPPERVSVPVICIGNFTAGGAGKTPTAIAVYDQLVALGERPHFLSRGYGGSETGPTHVDPTTHSATDVGDEPLLLSAHGPAWVSANRVEGALEAERAGASVIVLDDGFQNPSLHKDMSLIVVDTGAGIGNGAVMPAGPLREPLPDALLRTNAIVALAADEVSKNLSPSLSTPVQEAGLPVFHAMLEATPDNADKVAGRRFVAYAGIGRPEKFFSTLRQLDADVCETKVFADHHLFSEIDAAELLQLAETKDATLITTEKDGVRLRALRGPVGQMLRDASELLPVIASFSEFEALQKLLIQHLDAARTSHTYKPPGTRRPN